MIALYIYIIITILHGFSMFRVDLSTPNLKPTSSTSLAFPGATGCLEGPWMSLV